MLLRVPLTMFCGLAAYLVVAVMTVYDGFPSMVSQPVAGAILTGLAVVCVAVAGVPLLLPRV
jgi:hypothetical protein